MPPYKSFPEAAPNSNHKVVGPVQPRKEMKKFLLFYFAFAVEGAVVLPPSLEKGEAKLRTSFGEVGESFEIINNINI